MNSFPEHGMLARRRPWCAWVGGSCIILLVLSILGGWVVWNQISSFDIFQNNIVKDIVVRELGEEYRDVYDIIPIFLGFSEPQTYLVQFLNNTELRPGGGFIGSYAVIHVAGGRMEIRTLDGTENLDRLADPNVLPIPPDPLKQYLGVSRWFFRDSNWSPDFKESAMHGLSLYRAEGGMAAADIDGVIGVTPTVLEALLRIVGPVTVDGITFTSENVTETLEFEVEYAFADKNIPRHSRKEIIEPLFLTVMQRVKDHLLSEYDTYLEIAERLADEKQVLLYHTDPAVQDTIEAHGWAGRVEEGVDDYLLWVDANLGALKTDHALDRTLSYEIIGMQDDRYVARVTMTYKHTGVFDWRTTRYITYARVFVPAGSTFQSVTGTLRSGDAITPADVARGDDYGKSWFGTAFSVEPGQTKSLSFTYVLPASLARQRPYTVLIQKQPGSIDHALTLDLDFATLVQSAEPGEAEHEWGDTVYRYETDLTVDRKFHVNL